MVLAPNLFTITAHFHYTCRCTHIVFVQKSVQSMLVFIIGVNVPVVMLVLEGGMNTLKTAAETLKKKIAHNS